MNKTLNKIKASRPDLSDYLYHFTKGSSAFETLKKIILDGKLLDVNNSGVICFTEAPIYQMLEMFKIFKSYSQPMYAPYGIAISKKALFDIGARPVIYGPPAEKTLIDPSLHWRYENLTSSNDFSWLREWRLNKHEYEFLLDDIFVITNKNEDGLDFTHSPDVVIDGDYSDGKWWDMSFIAWDREIKSVSLETISELSINNSNLLLSEIANQDKEIKSKGSL